ncbi:MAG: DUF91 domain-containing protein [Candidatus Schekmanbacteria bacterium]|nr:MAG: DUF91 domain-containing protein [Candidatus Schekmanbacteria bacterium]
MKGKMNMKKEWTEHDLTIEQIGRGLLISQGGDSYVAKEWRLTQPVIDMIELALKYGLVCLIQNGHPQTSKREPKGDGAEYISFARKPNELSPVVLNANSPSNKKYRTDVKQVLFRKHYRHVLKQADIPFKVENFRNASNIEVPVEYVEEAIKACQPYFDIHAPKKGKRGIAGEYPGFRDEADIERWLMENLDDNSFDRRIQVIDRQVRVEGGIIDILIKDKDSGGLVILEVKQGRAQPVHVEEQIPRYLTSPYIQNLANGKPVTGCLVAELIESSVKKAIENSPHHIVGYEIKWQATEKVTLNKVVGCW